MPIGDACSVPEEGFIRNLQFLTTNGARYTALGRTWSLDASVSPTGAAAVDKNKHRPHSSSTVPEATVKERRQLLDSAIDPCIQDCVQSRLSCCLCRHFGRRLACGLKLAVPKTLTFTSALNLTQGNNEGLCFRRLGDPFVPRSSSAT